MPAPTIKVGSSVTVTGHGSTKQASAKLMGMAGTVVSITDTGNARVEMADGKTRTIGTTDLSAVRIVTEGPSKTEVFVAVRAVRQALRAVEAGYQINDYRTDTEPLLGAVAVLIALATEKADAENASPAEEEVHADADADSDSS